MMNLFIQSFIEDVREWYRGLPTRSIRSWEEFKRLFREQYGDKAD